jgi:hypothetical protein
MAKASPHCSPLDEFSDRRYARLLNRPDVHVRVDRALLTALGRACPIEKGFSGPELKWTPRQRQLATKGYEQRCVEVAINFYIRARSATRS